MTPAKMNPISKEGRNDERFEILNKSPMLSTLAASMTGMYIKKENRAADCLSNLRNIPPLMVAPERDMPGKIEIA